MLDIHPQPQQPRIAVRIGERTVDAGRLDVSTFMSDIHAARRVLASTIAERMFLKEQETEFEFLYHFDSVDECNSYLLAEAWCETEADEAVIESTRDVLHPGDGEILMRVPVLATRLKRLG
jgi:hypothetical protein